MATFVPVVAPAPYSHEEYNYSWDIMIAKCNTMKSSAETQKCLCEIEQKYEQYKKIEKEHTLEVVGGMLLVIGILVAIPLWLSWR